MDGGAVDGMGTRRRRFVGKTCSIISSDHETGPNQAQANFYYKFHTERIGFTTQRLIGEVERLYGILDARLADRDYIAGPGRGRYSIADISIWPFANALGIASIDMEEKFPNVYKWWERINRRTAVQKGTSVPSGKPFPAGYEAMQKMAKEVRVKFLLLFCYACCLFKV